MSIFEEYGAFKTPVVVSVNGSKVLPLLQFIVCMSVIASASLCLVLPQLFLLHKKAVSHVINSRALTGEKPCINKAIQALLVHGYATFNMIVPRPQICCRYEMYTARP